MADNAEFYDLIAASQKQMSLVQDTAAKLGGIAASTGAAAEEFVSAVMRGTDSRGETPLSVETKELAELEAQNRKQEFYKSLGGGQGYAKTMTSLADEFYKTMEEVKQLNQSVVARESVGLLDNPIAYALNRVILPDEKAALNAKASQAEFIAKQQAGLQKMTTDDAVVENEFAAKLSKEAIASKVEGLAANLTARAAQARMEANQQNSHSLTAVMNASGEELKTIKYIIDARNSAAHLALSQEQFKITQAHYKAWAEDRADNKAFDEQVTQAYNIAADFSGRPQLTVDKVRNMMKIDPKTTQAMVQMGFQSLEQPFAQFGPTPSAALDFSYTAKLPVPEGVKQILGEAKAYMNSPEVQAKLAGKDKAAADMVFNEYVQKRAKDRAEAIDYRDKTNPYLAPPPKIVGQNPAVASTVLWKSVIEPLSTAGSLTSSDPNKIVELGLQAVKEGKLGLSQLNADLGTYYTAGVLANTVAQSFHKYAIPETTSHKVMLEQPSVFGTNMFIPPKPVDLTDDTARLGYLVRRYSYPSVLPR